MARKLGFTVLTLVAASLVAACDGSSDGSGGGGSAQGGGGGDGGGDAGGGGGGGAQGGGGGAQGGGGGAQGGGGGAGGGDVAELPPAEQNAIFQWLKDGHYTGWAAESGVHASAGPHGGGVRTYVNAALLESLSAGNSMHPKGAAAVKELYDGATLSGWAVELKTDADSAGGQGWYWYENYSTTDPSGPVAAGNGKSLCFNCHSGGADHVLTPFPLQ